MSKTMYLYVLIAIDFLLGIALFVKAIYDRDGFGLIVILLALVFFLTITFIFDRKYFPSLNKISPVKKSGNKNNFLFVTAMLMPVILNPIYVGMGLLVLAPVFAITAVLGVVCAILAVLGFTGEVRLLRKLLIILSTLILYTAYYVATIIIVGFLLG